MKIASWRQSQQLMSEDVLHATSPLDQSSTAAFIHQIARARLMRQGYCNWCARAFIATSARLFAGAACGRM